MGNPGTLHLQPVMVGPVPSPSASRKGPGSHLVHLPTKPPELTLREKLPRPRRLLPVHVRL